MLDVNSARGHSTDTEHQASSRLGARRGVEERGWVWGLWGRKVTIPVREFHYPKQY